MRKFKILILFVFVFLALFARDFVFAQSFEKAEIYFNQACGMCSEYIQEDLLQNLKDLGIQKIEKKDYINEKKYRKELLQKNKRLEIPFDLQSHMMTYIDDGRLILAGHIPKHIFSDIKKYSQDLPKGLVIFQDKMDEDVEKYFVWVKGFPVQEYRIYQGLDKFLNWYKTQDKSKVQAQQEQDQKKDWKKFLGLILITGFLDGINPCAIAVLIFFLAFLFMLKSSIGRIVKFGILYIVVIYLTYLGIGFGLFKAVLLTGTPHLMAKIGSWLIIILGAVNVLAYFYPNLPVKLQMPKFSQDKVKYWLTKATLPAVIIGAFLVGLCTFPCSGGIYVAIISLLAARGTFWNGLIYMLIYNVMFVLPLVALLALIGNKYVLAKVAELQSKEYERMKLLLGLVMIILGIIILIWFV